jgi:adenylate kinase
VPFEDLVDRAANRWTCRTCQATYNYRVNPPRQAGVCDLDGGPLYQRDDDRLDVVSERIKVYIQDTVPVVDYYRAQGILHEIDGCQSIDAVASSIEAVLSELRERSRSQL